MDKVNSIFSFISIISVIPPLLLGGGLLLKNKLFFKYRPIVFLLAASLSADIVAKWAAKEFANNMPVSHIYSFAQAALLFWFFSIQLPHRKLLIKSVASLYLVYYIINSVWIESILSFNPTAKVIQNVLFLLACIYYFYNYYQRESSKSPEKDGVFWIVVGIFTFYSGTLFTYLLSSRILSLPNDSFIGTWILHNLTNSLKNIIFFLGLWIGRIR